MPDPALKKSLSPDDIENLTKAADFQLVRKTTPGLTPLSGADKWFIWGVILVISGVLYVNSIYPFLPFSLPPVVVPFVAVVFYVTIGVGFLMLFGIVLGVIWGVGALLWDRLFPRQPYVNCPRCGTRNKVKKYVEGQGCLECNSRLVYCAKCGKASDIGAFLSGNGCSHCGHEQISVLW
jgi:DNA-directed RNA polymerase subunit RPC12/RpoP